MGERLINWFEDTLIENIDDLDFGDLIDNPQQELFDFGVNSGTAKDRDVREANLESPILNNSFNVASDIYDKIESGDIYDGEFEKIGKLDLYGKAIDKNFKSFTAKIVGREIAKQNIRDRENTGEAVDWLRKYSPQTLGGLRRWEIQRIKDVLGEKVELF